MGMGFGIDHVPVFGWPSLALLKLGIHIVYVNAQIYR